MPSGPWHPIVEGELAHRAQAAVDEIAAALTVVEPPDATLAGGSAGLAVFFAELGAARNDDAHLDTSSRFLRHATEALGSVRMEPSLYSGFTGIAWAVDHLSPTPADRPDRLAKVDEALLRLVGRGPWWREYDLIDGLVGIGTYAASRLPRPGALELLGMVVDRLDELAERDPSGAFWASRAGDWPADIRRHYPERFVNLGLAHGVPGVSGLLGMAVGAGIEQARLLLDETVAWILAHRLAGRDARYPRWIADGEDPVPARSAWCYGDPGVAAALHVAARCANEPTWDAEAIITAHQVAQRSFEATRVVDAGLCHGAAGLAHIFNRMHHETGDAALADLARSWVARALDMREQPPSEPRLLTGAAGVGLALLAATGDRDPTWDRFLLLSAPGTVTAATDKPALKGGG